MMLIGLIAIYLFLSHSTLIAFVLFLFFQIPDLKTTTTDFKFISFIIMVTGGREEGADN